ncbi:microcystin-dependent protein [Bradyrhizobium sp. USDA 4472]
MVGLAWWSQTAAANATQDTTVNWAEGQAPSSVNDSARAMMASTAKWRDDIAGAIVTSGTSTAYTVTSYQTFDSLSRIANQVIAFTPHTTNDATVTLNVDGLGAKPLRSAPSVELPAGTLVQGTPYLALYNNSDAAFYLHGFFGNPYMVPIGALLDFTGSTSPNSSFVLPYGQAISRTTYASYFAIAGTTYGSGDGSTTFNIPDLRGRVIAGKDDMGGSSSFRLTTSYFGTNPDTLGAAGGSQSHSLSAAEIPTITSSVVVSGTLTGQTNSFLVPQSNTSTGGGGFGASGTSSNQNIGVSVSGSLSGSATSNNTSGAAHPTIPPTIIMNKLLRII